MENFSELLKVRRSMRKFTDEELTQEEVVTLMKAALMSPMGWTIRHRAKRHIWRSVGLCHVEYRCMDEVGACMTQCIDVYKRQSLYKLGLYSRTRFVGSKSENSQ